MKFNHTNNKNIYLGFEIDLRVVLTPKIARKYHWAMWHEWNPSADYLTNLELHPYVSTRHL